MILIMGSEKAEDNKNPAGISLKTKKEGEKNVP